MLAQLHKVNECSCVEITLITLEWIYRLKFMLTSMNLTCLCRQFISMAPVTAKE